MPEDEVKNMRDTKITKQTKEVFLERLAKCGSIPQACAGLVSRSTVYRWRQIEADFKEAFDRAIATFVEKLEREADRRGVEGVPKGVYYKGKRIATERDYSDSLLMFRLKSLAPEKYRDPPYRKERTASASPEDQKNVVIRVVYPDRRGDTPPGPQALPSGR